MSANHGNIYCHIGGFILASSSLLLLSSCAGTPPASAPPASAGAAGVPLTTTEWRLTAFESSDDGIGTIRPDPDELYTLQLQPDGSIAMQLSCNRGGGQWTSPDYRRQQGSIELTMGFATMAGCPPGRFDNLAARLGNVRSFVIRDRQLHLNLKMDGGNYVWVPATVRAAARDKARRVFDCGGGPEVEVVFHGNSAEVRAPGQSALMMQRRPGETLFAFETAIRSARLDGDVLTLITGRMAPIVCRASDKPIAALRGKGSPSTRRLS